MNLRDLNVDALKRQAQAVLDDYKGSLTRELERIKGDFEAGLEVASKIPPKLSELAQQVFDGKAEVFTAEFGSAQSYIGSDRKEEIALPINGTSLWPRLGHIEPKKVYGGCRVVLIVLPKEQEK